MRRLLLKHFLLVRINKMPSLHKKRSAPKKAGRKSHRKSPRNSHRKSPRHVKSGHKRSKSGRRVRGGGGHPTLEKGVAALGYGTVASDLGYYGGQMIGKHLGHEEMGSKIGLGAAGLAGAAYGAMGRNTYSS